MRKAFCLLALAAVVAAFMPAAASTAEAVDCGTTTLDGSLVLDEDTGLLQCGPPETTVVREELATASAERSQTRTALGTFATIADLQWADEESPLRGEWADKCPPDSPISDSAWRPQETMVGQLADSHVDAVNRIAAEGTPVLDRPLDLVLTLGDLADNQQWNEIRYFIDVFDGGKLIDPDSGNDPVLDGDGYDGVQAQDPEGSGVALPGPGEGGPEGRILDIANEPFFAGGLRYPDGSRIPWYALPGNHDVKVQGTIADDNAAWRAAVRRYATGHVKIMDLAPDYQARLCEAFAARDPEAAQAVLTDIFSNPQDAGTTKIVPSDPGRMPLYRMEEEKDAGDEEACLALTQNPLCESSWIHEVRNDPAGVPAGHGYADENRCRDESGAFIPRLCYSFVSGDFLFIGLDTSPQEGLERGSVDPAQFDWMERTIRAHSSSYLDEQGNEVANPTGDDKLVVVYSHHPTNSLTNTGLYSSAEERNAPENDFDDNGGVTGPDLEAMLLRYPNVILHSSGHTHENNIWLHKNEATGTGYWEVNTASVADMPSESRVMEVADNRDGTLSIFSTIFEAAAPPDPRHMHWETDDPTPEDGINETWLASFGREVGYHDPQQNWRSATGTAATRNVELLVPAPFDLGPDEIATALTYTGATSGRIGKTVPVSAVLRDTSGAPVAGMTVTFQRGDAMATAVTDAEGIARTRLHVLGPKGSTRPIAVRFDGSGLYLPSAVDVPFTATSGS